MLPMLYLFAATALALGLTTPAGAQRLSSDKNLTYEQVKVIAETVTKPAWRKAYTFPSMW